MAPSPQQCGSRPADTTPRNRRSRSADPNTSQRTESKYRTLGPTGTSVANLALGTMGFGTETPEDEALTVIDAYVEAGGNVLDTSDVYGAGASETTLGRWFAARPGHHRPHRSCDQGTVRSRPRHRVLLVEPGFAKTAFDANIVPPGTTLAIYATSDDWPRRSWRSPWRPATRRRSSPRRSSGPPRTQSRAALSRRPAGQTAADLAAHRSGPHFRQADPQVQPTAGLTNWRRGSPQHLAELVF